MGRSPSLLEAQLPLFAIDPLALIGDAIRAHKPIARVALLSGGDDSSALTHWLWTHDEDGHWLDPDDRSLDRGRLMDFAAFIDTGTGISETQTFARRFCRTYGIPLTVLYTPAGTYERMVLRWGFPGPAGHGVAYNRLKERQLEALIRTLKAGQPRNARVLLYTGVRRAESRRRMGTTEPVNRNGSTVWVAPFIDWPKSELRAWCAHHDVPRSDVAALIHMSGECLCGAFGGGNGELEMLDWAFPPAARWIRALQTRATFFGVERDRWGGEPGESPIGPAGPMCSDCEQRQLGLDVSGCTAKPRPRVLVHQVTEGTLGDMRVRVHTPGRTPGADAVVVHGADWVVIDDHVRADGGDLAVMRPNRTDGFSALGEHPGTATANRSWVGSTQTAVDLTVVAPKRARRSKGNANWPYGLIVYGMTSRAAPAAFTPGPVRLANHDKRVQLDRVRLIRGRLLIDEHPIAGYCRFADRFTGEQHTGWVIESVGRFQQLLVIRRCDQDAIEVDWANAGIHTGYIDPDTGDDWHQPLVVPARHPGPTFADLGDAQRAAWADRLRATAETLDGGVRWDDDAHARVRCALAHVDPRDSGRLLTAFWSAVADEGYRAAGCLGMHPAARGEDWAPASARKPCASRLPASRKTRPTQS